MDSDTYPAPLRAPVGARHRERYAASDATRHSSRDGRFRPGADIRLLTNLAGVRPDLAGSLVETRAGGRRKVEAVPYSICAR
jgi:hypothetical protein